MSVRFRVRTAAPFFRKASSGTSRMPAFTRMLAGSLVAAALQLTCASQSFASSGCDDINAYWGSGQTFSGDAGEWQAPLSLDAGDKITYVVTSSGSTNSNANMGSGFALYTSEGASDPEEIPVQQYAAINQELNLNGTYTATQAYPDFVVYAWSQATGGTIHASVTCASATATITPPAYPVTQAGNITSTLSMTLSQAPATGLTVTPTAAGLTFNPPSITFGAGTTSQTFTVTAAANATPGSTAITYALSGPNAAQYTAPAASAMTVLGAITPPAYPVLLQGDTSSILTMTATAAGAVSVTPSGAGLTFTPPVVNFSGAATQAFAVTAASNAGPGPVVVSYTLSGAEASFYVTPASGSITVSSPVPMVSSISPATGPTGGGTSVTLTGANFTGATAVRFGATAATSFTVNSATSITVTAPAGPAGTVDVTVTSAAGTSATSAADQYTYVASPTVTGLLPSSGPLAGGTTVTIMGANLTNVTAVHFGSAPATSLTVNSATSITAVAPASAAGTVDVTVTSPGGTSATSMADQYTYVPAPTVSSIGPTAGPVAGGTVVTLTGTGFSGATAVTFGATAATSFTVNSATSITAVTPANSAGTVDVRVTTANGTSATSAADQYTYIAAPTVSSISPTAGPSAGGTTVMIHGTGFSDTTSVTFGATAATSFTIDSASQITATTPAGTGTVDIVVTTAGGTSATSAADQFTYLAAPAVTGISPTSGPSIGGTTVTITGTNFTAATAVTFGATAASGFTVNSAISITATAPSGSGIVDIRVTTAGGTSATSASDQFTYVSAPTVSSVSPNTGPAAGGTTVVITGTNFTGTSVVTFGATTATSFTVNSATQITATTPAHAAGPADIVVMTTAGSATFTSGFTYLAAIPTVTAISPGSGPQAGGTSVTITGTDLAGATAVTFGGSAASGFTVNSATQITATTPAHAAGAVDVAVTAPGGSAILTNGYAFLNPPVVSGVVATVAQNSSANPITLAITGGAATSVAVSTAAAHGTATASGTAITYTPAAGYVGSDSFAYTATNADGTSAPATVSIAVSAPTISIGPASLSAGAIGTSYNETVTASGGTGPYIFTAGSLPAGLTLSSGGVVSGTPTAGGTFNFTITATDSSTGTGAPFSASRAYSLTIADPTISIAPTILTAAAVNTAYSRTITASGGTAGYSYAVTAGSLPAGLTLSSGGTLSGTPTASGSFNFTITATDSSTGTGPFTGSRAYSLSVTANPPVANGVAATVAPNSTNNPITLDITGGAATSVAVATAATHGTATASGTAITYTPATGYSGSDSFTYIAINSEGTSAPATVSVTVSIPTISVSPSTLSAASVAVAYSQTITASGGTSAYSYAITAGALPSGLTLSPAGAVSGTPTAGGSFNFTITATDSSTGTGAPFSGSRAYSLTVASPSISIAPATLPAATVATAYSQSVTASGGTASYSYAVTAGALPTGLTLSSGGALSGTPTASGSFNFTITATDSSTGSGPFTGSRAYTLTTNVQPPIAGSVSATVAANSSANPITLNITGGTAVSVAVATGAGHGAASASGTAITYTPTAGYSGPDSFTYTATNSSGTSAPATVSVTVSAPTLSFSPASGALAAGMMNAAYSQTVTASGGTSPYSYAVTAGALPPGLTLNHAAGAITGTPTTSGNYSVSIGATDANNATTSVAYTIAIAPPPTTFVFTPAGGALSEAMAGEAYSQQISASGGTGTKIYSLASGSLPNGLVLNISTGQLTGPLAAGTEGDYSFAIQVRDGNGATASASYTLKVKVRAITVADKVIDVPAGSTPADVYLNGGATGGPFTSADLAFVEPANAGTATIIQGQLAAAGPVATPVGWYLHYTPNPAYSGQVRIGYKLVSAFGASNTGTVTYNIRYDAGKVAEDIDNLVHGFVQSRQNMIANTIEVPGLLQRRQMEKATDPVTGRMTPSEEGMTLGFSTSLSQIRAAGGDADAASAPFNVWIGGAFLAHNDKSGNDSTGKWGSFAMINMGADYLISDHALIGLSFHYDRMTDPTDEDAKLTGNGWLAGPYASLELGRGVFWNGSLRYGGSSNTIDTQFWDGSFRTTRWMADTSIEGQWNLDEDTTVSPKLRAIYFSETVDDYTVKNGAGDALTIDGFDEEQFRVSLGAEIARSFTLESGAKLTPKLGVTGGFSGLDGTGAFGAVTAGLTLQTANFWMLDTSLLFNIEGDGETSVGAKVSAAKKF